MTDGTPEAPRAARRPRTRTLHGEVLTDEYGWLQRRDDPEVIAHLEAENAHADAATRALEPLADRLYDEMLARIQQTDLSVPYRKGGYWYYSRTEEGRQYPILARRLGDPDAAPEQVLLDVNALAVGHPYMAVGDFEVSPDGCRLAYSTDPTGYRQYALHVLDLVTGALSERLAERVTSVAWSADSQALWYTQEHPESKRSHRLLHHRLGEDAHVLAYEEPDERFSLAVALTRSEQWLVQSRTSHTTSEIAVREAADAGAPWRVLAPRRQDVEYDVDHRGDAFWIRTNDRGRNFRLVTAPVASPEPEHWREVLPHRPDVMLAGVDAFARFIVLFERAGALPGITLLDPDTHERRPVPFTETAYAVGPSANAEYDTDRYRYTYQSFLTPPSVFELDLASLASRCLKRTEVLGGWDPGRYAMHREWFVARDGTRVPITLLARRDHPRDGTAGGLLYAYGAYGVPQNASFGSSRFSLVDRGMVFAIAHVRGGGDLGKPWHDAGRMASKRNTFTDFLDAARWLEHEGWVRPRGLVGQGGSAGGLLIGAVANEEPGRFAGLFAQVPFVDVINTMLDPSLPLTVGEYEEWGDPADPEQYAWIRAYSPYENVARQAYPPLLVRTSLHDSQVMYWEPAKWVARLRERRANAAPLLLRCHMGAGHGGASGRYDALRDLARDYAWILDTLGLASAPGFRP